MKKFNLLLLAFVTCLYPGISFAQSNLALKICTNTAKGTLIARVKCKKGESVVSPASIIGATGATGATGSQGPQGPQGSVGASAFNNIPSGTTVYGVIGWDGHNPSGGADYFVLSSLPAKTAQILTDSDILIAPTASVNNDCTGALECRSSTEVTEGAVCTGSAATPTAPSGKVCIYVNTISSLTTAGSLEGYILSLTNPTITPGFRVKWVASAAADTYMTATWAYTAP